MATRSLQASPQGIEAADRALNNRCLSQTALAKELGISRETVNKFFRCSPVDRQNFVQICEALNLEWDEIVAKPLNKPNSADAITDDSCDADVLVQKVRLLRHDKIQSQCGTMRMLDISQQIELVDIYTDVYILKDIPSQQWRELSDILQEFRRDEVNPDKFDRFSVSDPQKRIAGWEALQDYSKLMVLGKPGSGKTTFLQYAAIQCQRGQLQSDRIPIFIRLKNFAEDARDTGDFRLLNYINQDFCSCGISVEDSETLLNHGKALILLDGLDEVQEQDSDEVVKQIRRFSEKYYKNQFIITCRTAVQKYRFQEQGFTDVQVADFNLEQIEFFARKWFVAVTMNSVEEGLAKAEQFIQTLKLPINKQIRELIVTPILLNLTCLVFASKEELPSERSKLYEKGLDILLRKWDEERGIKRDEVYCNLSLPHKLKLLSQVAAITFEKSNYFFERGKIQQLIADYLRTVPDTQAKLELLQLDSEAVLKAIEAQHGLLVERAQGIYSFSHLTFHEYFTARNFVYSSNEQALINLSSHMSEYRWREVFLLSAAMLPRADNLLQLIWKEINLIIDSDDILKTFFIRLHQESSLLQSFFKVKASVRSWFLLLGYHNPDKETIVILGMSFVIFFYYGSSHTFGYLPEQTDDFTDQLLNVATDKKNLEEWWKANGQFWIKKLGIITIKSHNISHEYQLSENHKKLIQKCREASLLLLDCLNSSYEVTPDLRQEIEETLLLPSSEIEKRKIT